MPDLDFWSADRKFGLKIPEEKMAFLLERCIQSKPNEIGGILIGFYTTAHDCAVVTIVSKPPADSHSGRAYFVRGIRGLQKWIDDLWRKTHHYYLGEWHFHPGGDPLPSPTDSQQMKKIANAFDYQCPEPILLIIGGNPPKEWTVRAYAFPRKEDLIELIRTYV